MTKETFTPKSGTGSGTDPGSETGTAANRAARRASGSAGSGSRVNTQSTRARQVPRSRRGRQISSARARRRTMLLFVGIPIVFVVVFIGVLLAVSNGPSGVGLVNSNDLNPGSTALAVGTKAPDFTLKTVDGKSYSLSSSKGKPVLLEFFAVWCPHCQAEAKVLNQLDAAFGPHGLTTIAVLASPYGRNYDNSGQTDLTIATKSDINWFTSTFNVKHLTLIDPTFATVNKYNASSYPTLYILDKNGIIRFADTGEQPYNAMATVIQAALK
jgi:peroxiredoxin